MNPKVDWYFDKAGKWQEEIIKLRTIALDSGLSEELKWGCPCYTLGGANIMLIHVFKEYCAFLFFKGALLSDPKGLLVQQTENVQAARQLRFTGLLEIAELEPFVTDYIKEAIKVEEAGLKVPLKTTSAYAVPAEFQQRLDAMPALKAAFEALTPGRQRAYLFHFSQPKLSVTRESRVEKYMHKILDGKGLED
jgi:uncharacterized protein YdeI (YjbR/CyaY-like superfamily)